MRVATRLIVTGFILYMVSRECVYFINIRQAYLLAPHYADRLSSRTVLFTCVTQNVLDERKLRRVFGDSVKNVWIPRDTADLDELVKEREQTANRLERAEMLLIKKANTAYQKMAKTGHPDVKPATQASSFSETKEINGKGDINVTETAEPPTSPQSFARSDGTPIMATSYGLSGPSFDINGSIAAQWIGAEERPYHRPIANYGRRVDTIKWTRTRLKEIGVKISKLRRDYRKGKGAVHPAVFIEFHTQVDAQAAYQTLAHHRANHMRSEIVGVRPEEIIWESLYFRWWERIIRRFLIQGFVAVMVIFWSVPAAIVGSISNVKTLASEIFFLSWLVKLPSIIIGLISGLLPAVALATLMAIVPMIMRGKFTSLVSRFSLTPPSMRPSSRRSNRGQNRALCPKRLLRLPNRPSIPHHHPDLRCICSHNINYQRPTVCPRAALQEPAQSLQFLHLVLHLARLRFERHEDRTSRRHLQTSAHVPCQRQPSEDRGPVSSTQEDPLGKCVSCVYEHGRNRYHVFDYCTYCPRCRCIGLVLHLSNLPIQSPLYLLFRARYARSPLPARSPPSLDRRLPR